jgi:hypothetical protein
MTTTAAIWIVRFDWATMYSLCVGSPDTR